MRTILGAGVTTGIELAKELSLYTNPMRLVSRNPKKTNPTDEPFPADLHDPSVADKALHDSDATFVTVGFEYITRVWQACWVPLMNFTNLHRVPDNIRGKPAADKCGLAK